MLRGDVIGFKDVRDVLIIRSYNTKGKQETREIQIHPQLKEYLAEHHERDRWHTRPDRIEDYRKETDESKTDVLVLSHKLLIFRIKNMFFLSNTSLH